VLPGKIYNNGIKREFDKKNAPDFNLPFQQIKVNQIIPLKYYLIANETGDLTTAKQLLKILSEQGVKCHIGQALQDKTYYLYTSYFDSKKAARERMNSYSKEIKETMIIQRFKNHLSKENENNQPTP